MTIDKMALVRRGFALLSRLRSPTLLGGYGESKARLAHSVVILVKQEILKAVRTPDPSDCRMEGCGVFGLLTVNSACVPLIFKTAKQINTLWGFMIADKSSSALKHKSGPNSLIFSFSSGASPAHNAGGRVLPLFSQQIFLMKVDKCDGKMIIRHCRGVVWMLCARQRHLLALCSLLCS